MILDKIKIFFLIPFLILILFNSCSNSNVSIDGYTMGTTYSIKIYSKKYVNSSNLKEIIENKLNDISSIFSTYHDSTEISKINLSNSNKFILSSDLSFVLSKAIYYSELSDGLYDLTVFPLVDLWGFGPTIRNSKPKESEINNLLKNVSYKNISINNNELFINNSDTYIDLSSIAKGYAVDIISKLLLEKGFSNFMVEIGGEVRCNGKNNENEWIIGIINPYNENDLIKTNIVNKSMATSGNYNNFTIYDDNSYSHIINPKTGWPIINNIISATVIADDCIDADAIATILMLLPSEKGMKLIDKMENVEALVFIDGNQNFVKIKSKNFDKYLY